MEIGDVRGSWFVLWLKKALDTARVKQEKVNFFLKKKGREYIGFFRSSCSVLPGQELAVLTIQSTMRGHRTTSSAQSLKVIPKNKRTSLSSRLQVLISVTGFGRFVRAACFFISLLESFIRRTTKLILKCSVFMVDMIVNFLLIVDNS